jgi:CysZ protein
MGLSFILMILGLFPLFSPISGIMIFLIQSYYAGFGSMDYTMERHLDVKHSIRFIHQNRGLTLGIGIVFMLILMIPVLGILLVLPLSTVAGTKVTLDRLEKLKD